MKYTLTVEAEADHELLPYMQVHDYYCVLCTLRDEARRLWKHSQDEAEIAKGEGLKYNGR